MTYSMSESCLAPTRILLHLLGCSQHELLESLLLYGDEAIISSFSALFSAMIAEAF